MATTVYYFTGTGNSLKIAKDISAAIGDSDIVRIDNKLMNSGRKDAPAKLGIVFPVYADGLPVIVEKFINDLNMENSKYIFAVANFGGGAGMSLFQMESLIVKKGKKLASAFEILMPDNTQIMFPPLSPEEQEECLNSALKKIPEIADAAKAEKTDITCIERLREKGKSWKRHPFEPDKMEKEFWTDDKCDSCSICEKVCPVSNIKMKDGKPAWQGHCEQCLACMQWCPRESIQFGKRTGGWGRYHNPYIKVKELFN